MKIPLFPLDVVLLPGAALPLHIFEPRYKEMAGLCLQQKSGFGVVRAQRHGMAVTGCMASIVSVLRRWPDGRMDILCRGEGRFQVRALDAGRSYLQAEADFFDDIDSACPREDLQRCVALHREMQWLTGNDGTGVIPPAGPGAPVSFLLAAEAPMGLDLKQWLLESRSERLRLARMEEFYNALLPRLRTGVLACGAANSAGRVM